MSTDTNQEAEAKIAALNDEYRKGPRFTVTPGVQEIEDFLGLIQAVREYADFNEDNDPYGEKVYWKIGYYDQVYETWYSPLSPDCNRVLTIMLAEEY